MTIIPILLKFGLVAFLFFMSLGVGFMFAMVGIWSAIAFALLSFFSTVLLRYLNGAGNDRVYFIAFSLGLFVEMSLLAISTDQELMGMRKILGGYSVPLSTQVIFATVPFAIYVICLVLWTHRLKP